MSIASATTLLTVAAIWCGLGLAVGVPFVVFGVGRVDPSARGGSLGFRLVILPGVVALWPWMLWRWLAGGPPPEPRDAHRRAAGAPSATPTDAEGRA